MGPNCPNSFSRSFSLVYKLRPNTPRTLQESGFSLLALRLPPREGGDLPPRSRELGVRERLLSGVRDFRESGDRERLDSGDLDLDFDLDLDLDSFLPRDVDLLLDGIVLVIQTDGHKTGSNHVR